MGTVPAASQPQRDIRATGRSEFGEGVVMQQGGGRVTVLSEEAGYRTLDVETALEGDLLVPC